MKRPPPLVARNLKKTELNTYSLQLPYPRHVKQCLLGYMLYASDVLPVCARAIQASGLRRALPHA